MGRATKVKKKYEKKTDEQKSQRKTRVKELKKQYRKRKKELKKDIDNVGAYNMTCREILQSMIFKGSGDLVRKILANFEPLDPPPSNSALGFERLAEMVSTQPKEYGPVELFQEL